MQAPAKTSLWGEIRTLFWLQWKLTQAMFRSTRLSVQLRFLGLLLQLVTFVFTFPLFILMGTGIAILLAVLSPQAAYETALLINSFVFFIWLLMPTSNNSQFFERFEMLQLFPYPISFRGIVVGSTLMSLLTMTGLWTIPILLGEVIGLGWHNPIAIPLILLGAVPTFALLVLTGRIIEDLFDLVASDRRLRALMLVAFMLPFLIFAIGQQYFVQIAMDNFEQVNQFIPAALINELENLENVESMAEFWQGLSNAIEILNLSRFLIWLPPGWVTAGMGQIATQNWGLALFFLLVSFGSVTLLLWLHANITRQLMKGTAVSIGTERVRRQRRFLQLPGPKTFWALFHKDWLHLKRSPLPRQLFLPLLIIVFTMIFIVRILVQDGDMSAKITNALPVIVVSGAIALISMANNMTFTANYFGAVDRDGFASLATSPVDRRYILLSANLAAMLYMGLQTVVITLGVTFATGEWYVLPLGLYLGLCLQIGSTPTFNFAAIMGPYRTQYQFINSQQQGNLWGILAWLVATPPILLLVLLPYFLWKPGLILSLPLGLIVSLGFYGLTFEPLARLLQKRESTILKAVVADE